MADDNDEAARIAVNQHKRPHYPVGTRVRVMTLGPYQGVVGTVRDVVPLQALGRGVETYLYTLELPNLERSKWFEADIGPLVVEG